MPKAQVLKNTNALKPVAGANVMFCGHNGYFVADIYVIGDVAVVVTDGPVTGNKLNRSNELGPPTHHLSDFPCAGYWGQQRGIFVVPKFQVTVLEQ